LGKVCLLAVDAVFEHFHVVEKRPGLHFKPVGPVFVDDVLNARFTAKNEPDFFRVRLVERNELKARTNECGRTAQIERVEKIRIILGSNSTAYFRLLLLGVSGHCHFVRLIIF